MDRDVLLEYLKYDMVSGCAVAPIPNATIATAGENWKERCTVMTYQKDCELMEFFERKMFMMKLFSGQW